MPFLGRLASLLVVGDEQAQVVGFQMGGLVKLEPKVDRDGFSVAWALPPPPMRLDISAYLDGERIAVELGQASAHF